MTSLVTHGVAAVPASLPRAVTEHETPFVVAGTVHGWRQVVGVHDPEEALDEIIEWCASDPGATGSWFLRADCSEGVTVAARIKAGLALESQRSAHLFVLAPGIAQGANIVTQCGEILSLVDLEWLPLGGGMPCETCLVRASR